MTLAPSKFRNGIFLFFLLITFAANIAGGCLNYVIWSEGELGRDLYRTLAQSSMGLYVAAGGVAILCILFTAFTYILSFDHHRPARPRLSIYLLLFSFCFFITAYVLGTNGVPVENIPAFVGGVLASLVLPLAVFPIESQLGKIALRSAQALFRGGSIAKALRVVQWSLALRPANKTAEDLYGRCLAETGNIEAALPILERSLGENPDNPDLLRLFYEHYAGKQDAKRELEFLEHLQKVQPKPRQFERLVELWRADGQTERVLTELQKLQGDERKAWHPLMVELLFELKKYDAIPDLAHELELYGPPFTASMDCWEKLAEAQPLSPLPLEALTGLYDRLGNRAMAIQYLEQLTKLHPDDPSFRRKLIAHCRETHQTDAVRFHQEELVRRGQANTREKLDVANALFTLAEHTKLEKMLRGDPDMLEDPMGAYLLAAMLFETRRWSAALDQVRRARLLDPENDVRSLLLSLENRTKARILEDELQQFGDQVHSAPDNEELQFSYIDRLVASHSYEKAVLELDQMLERIPGKRDKITTSIEQLLEKHGNNFRLMAYLADIRLREGKAEAVFDLYRSMAAESMTPDDVLREGAQKVLDIEPGYLPALFTIAEVSAHSGDHEQVLTRIGAFHAAGGEISDATARLEFEACRKLGRTEEAIATGETLLQMHPDDYSLLGVMAQLLEKADKLDGALRCYHKLHDHAPEDLETNRSIARVEQVVKRKRLDLLLKRLTTDPNTGPIHEEIGDIYHDFGQMNDAIVSYQKAALRPELHDVATTKLAYVLARKTMYTEAQEALNEAELRFDQAPELQKKMKTLMFKTAELMESDRQLDMALAVYKRIFRVDAGYRDVVERIERLQRLHKPGR